MGVVAACGILLGTDVFITDVCGFKSGLSWLRALAITESSTLKKCDEFTARKTLTNLMVFVDNAVFGTDWKIKESVSMMKKQEKREVRTLKTHHLLFLSILFSRLCKEEFFKMQHGEKNNRYLSNLVWENFFFWKIITVVILGQHYVRLSDAALNNSFFSKICFIKSSSNMLLNIGVVQIWGAFL